MRYHFEEMRAMSEDPTMEMLAEIDRDLADIEKAVHALQEQAAAANYPQQVETTTDRLAEIEGQAEYTPPEGWRVLAVGEVLREGDVTVRADGYQYPTERVGSVVGAKQRYIRRIEPQPEPEPQAAKIEELRSEVSYVQRLLGTERRRATQLEELVTSLRTINEAQEKAFEAAGKENTALRNQLEAVKAESAKRLDTIQELRSEVSHVQRLWGESRRRVEELETLVADLRAVNTATERAVNSAARDKADLQHRLDTVAAEWALQAGQISGLQQQLEAVKAELVQQAETSRRLQIELDAAQQVPQAVSDRFEEGWDAGTARAVETIAEWLEPIKAAMDAADNQDELARAGFFAIDTIRHLPHIMRSLTGLTDKD